MISARDLTLRIGTRTLLNGTSFDLRAGEFVAVLGPNGVGKTTLLRTLAGVRAPDEGAVLVRDRDVRQLRAGERGRLIAHIAGDDLFLDQLLVRDVVAMGRYPHHRWWQWHAERRDDAAVRHALSAVHMEPFAERRFDTLSSGERQRIWIALALAQEAPLLLLDEPTSHLDVRVAQEILHLLQAQVRDGKTVVCALHDINEAAQFADRLLLLGCARVLAFAEPAAVLDPELLERAYGIRMETLRSPSGVLRVFPASHQGSCASGMPLPRISDELTQP
ncbi:MAG TPA: ABC transporter ATP-binding protein [Candidatus Baltobacteraceae bacterium]|nr:ABC transporter ATP-binding protein [Candidatus Baltobacteraceae bacterium]